jgi:biopolymer transport protein ExbD
VKFEKNIKSSTSIPTASMGDIVFMLLLFFMVTTVFKTEDGLPVDLPRAESGVEPKRELVSHIWIDRKGRISIDDKLVTVDAVFPIMLQKYKENPLLIVAFQTDTKAKYEVMDSVMEKLKEANAVRVSFNDKFESSAGPKY